MIKAVIFDLDGTLLNTLYDLYDATNHALLKNNLKKRSMEEIQSFVGNGIGELISKAIGFEDEVIYQKVLNDFSSYYLLHSLDNTKPYDGIIDMLKKFKKQNIKIAIVSNKFQQGVDKICSLMFKEYVNLALGESKQIKRKPAPDMIYEACKLLNIDVKEALFVGDSQTDVLTANNANMEVIGVSWGFRGYDILSKMKVNYIVNKPEEIISIVKEKNNGKNLY